jgi:hypothetical protein
MILFNKIRIEKTIGNLNEKCQKMSNFAASKNGVLVSYKNINYKTL